MRAVSLDAAGRPEARDVEEPDGAGDSCACSRAGCAARTSRSCGRSSPARSSVTRWSARPPTDARVALVHHRGCGECERCRAGHESTCDQFAAPTIRPGGFAERVRADAWIDLPAGLSDAEATALEPLACVVRGADAVPPGRVLVLGQGFVGRLFASVLTRRGDEVFALDADPRRSGREPDGPVDAVVICAPGPRRPRSNAVAPAGTILVFADAGALPAEQIYRRELTVVGRRSASPDAMLEALAILPELELPEPTVLPLHRFDEGLDLFLRRDAAKVVFVP